MSGTGAPYRIGLLGSGWISRTYARALREVEEGELVAVWSRTRENAERFAREHGLALGTDDVDAGMLLGVEHADFLVNRPQDLGELLTHASEPDHENHTLFADRPRQLAEPLDALRRPCRHKDCAGRDGLVRVRGGAQLGVSPLSDHVGAGACPYRGGGEGGVRERAAVVDSQLHDLEESA